MWNAERAAVATELAGVRTLHHRFAEAGRPLDILINNAGLSLKAPFATFPPAYWDEVMALNVKAPFMIVQALHPLLRHTCRDGRPAQS